MLKQTVLQTPLSDEVVSNSEWKVDPDVDRGYAEERFTAKCHPGTSGFEGVVRIPNKLGEAITAINDSTHATVTYLKLHLSYQDRSKVL